MLIWWLTQDDCDEMMMFPKAFNRLPDWLRREVNSRYGRNGRGRLWAASDVVGDVPDIVWPKENTPFTSVLARSYGGIVIRDRDIEHIRNMPGIVTSYQLVRVHF